MSAYHQNADTPRAADVVPAWKRESREHARRVLRGGLPHAYDPLCGCNQCEPEEHEEPNETEDDDDA